MAMKDYYKILGISRNATQEEIRDAYRRLAKKYHPDVNKGNKEAEEKFKDINEAYQVLGDPEKRKKYDAMLNMGVGPSGVYTGVGGDWNFNFSDMGFPDLEDLFSSIFGTVGGEKRNQEKGEDIEVERVISLEEVLKGTVVDVSYNRLVRCRVCEGTGYEKSKGGMCITCNGEGYVNARRGFISYRQSCPTCGGTGRSGRFCSACTEGRVMGYEKLSVKVPQGVEDGEVMRIIGKGNAGRFGGPSGNLYVKLRVKPHPVFERKGRDLYYTLSISPYEAILGGEVEVPTLEENVVLKIPPGTDSGTKLRLKGKGLPQRGGGRRGNIYVDIKIVVPKNLLKSEVDAIKKMENILKRR